MPFCRAERATSIEFTGGISSVSSATAQIPVNLDGNGKP